MKKNLTIAVLAVAVIAQGIALKDEKNAVDVCINYNKRLVRLALYQNQKLRDMNVPWDQFDDIAVRTIIGT